MDSELSEFPLRMRDWLKNVLVTLYERDENNNLLNEKQKLRVSHPLRKHGFTLLRCSSGLIVDCSSARNDLMLFQCVG